MDQGQPNQKDADVSELIHQAVMVCKKRRWLIALAALLTVVGANVGLRFVPNKYRSEATILALGNQISSSFVTPLSSATLEETATVAAREVLSGPRLLEIVNEFGLATGGETSQDDALDTLRKNLEIESAGLSVFRVSFTAKTPQLALGVTKRLADLFIERHSQLAANQVQTATSLIEGQLAERRRKLAELVGRMAAFKGQYAGELSDERPENLEDWRQARTRLDNVTASRERATEQRTILESTLVGTLNARLTHLQEERAVLLRSFTPKHPDVVNKDQQIAQVRAEMEEFKAGAGQLQRRQSPLASADPAITQLEGQLEANSLEIDSLAKEAAQQTSLIAEYQGRLNKNPVHEQQLSSMELETRELNDEITELVKKEQQSGLAADMERREEGQEFRLVDPPTLPSHPSSKKRQTASLGALVAGPLLGIIFAYLLEFRSPTFRTENELRRSFGPPLVLSIPALQTPRERRVGIWRTGFELLAGSVLVVGIAVAELYAYKLLS